MFVININFCFQCFKVLIIQHSNQYLVFLDSFFFYLSARFMILSHCGLIYYLVISNLECISYLDWASEFPFQWMHLYILCLLYYWLCVVSVILWILITDCFNHCKCFLQFFSFSVVCLHNNYILVSYLSIFCDLCFSDSFSTSVFLIWGCELTLCIFSSKPFNVCSLYIDFWSSWSWFCERVCVCV